MKKFLIVLAMVVTASLLMGAGCFTVNTPPIITTLALPDATVGTAYTATVKATDADGDALTFSVSGPTGMVISGAGVISGWTPAEAGTENVAVAVTDGTDLVSANFIIKVSAVEPEPPEPNQAPVITSTAITSGKVGVAYTYDVDATDPDEDILTYSLTEKPLGMAIVAGTGVISWDPTDAGVFGVGVKVSDPDGLFDVQGFSIVVVEADEEEEEPVTYTLIMQVNPSGGGTTVPAVGTHPDYTAGTVIIVIATPATGYEFVNWAGGVTGTDNPTTVTMDADKIVIASFELIVGPIPTVAPIITGVDAFDIASTATLYVNKAEAEDGIVVYGTAPTLSEVKVYIKGLTAGTGNTEDDGTFSVVVANADLIRAVRTDGAKVLYAKAKEIGKLESVPSNEVEFILDTELPTIEKCSAKAGTRWVKGTASTTGLAVLPGLNEIPPDIVSGVWTVDVIGVITGPWFRVRITDPNGDQTEYQWLNPTHYFSPDNPIPGVGFKLANLTPLDVGEQSQITCVAETPAVFGYIDVTFDADVTSASMLAPPAGTGVWTAFAATTNLKPTVTVIGAAKARLTEWKAGIMKVGEAYSVSVSGPTDLAGNSIPASDPESCTGVSQ